jgi:hypothetical protein
MYVYIDYMKYSTWVLAPDTTGKIECYSAYLHQICIMKIGYVKHYVHMYAH